MNVAHSGADVFLQPGQFWFGGGAVLVRTLLGSCVAITLWHRHERLGGVCHYMLPHKPVGAGTHIDGRYATDAMRFLVERIAVHGLRPDAFEAKLFGGGRMLASRSLVPQRNIDIARALLAEHRIATKAEHLGGSGHRVLHFDAATGDAWLRHRSLVHSDIQGNVA